MQPYLPSQKRTITLEYITVNSQIFANGDKRYICYVKNSRLEHDLPSSVNDRAISPFREGFLFSKLRLFRDNKILTKISEFTVYIQFIVFSK